MGGIFGDPQDPSYVGVMAAQIPAAITTLDNGQGAFVSFQSIGGCMAAGQFSNFSKGVFSIVSREEVDSVLNTMINENPTTSLKGSVATTAIGMSPSSGQQMGG